MLRRIVLARIGGNSGTVVDSLHPEGSTGGGLESFREPSLGQSGAYGPADRRSEGRTPAGCHLGPDLVISGAGYGKNRPDSEGELVFSKISLFLAALTLATLSGCAGFSYGSDPEYNWYVSLEPGSRVVVTQPLTAPSGVRVSFQNGRLVRRRDIVQWQPYCQFRVWRPEGRMSEPLIIEPDTFIVQRTRRSKDSWAVRPVRNASSVLDEDFRRSQSQRTMATYIELRSDSQPRVMYLRCARWAEPYNYNHVNISDIREALGERVRLMAN